MDRQLLHMADVPVWVWDNFFSDPSPVIDLAGRTDFARPHRDYYPGLRSAELPASVQDWLPAIDQLPGMANARCLSARFSLATQRACELSALQWLPHFDTTANNLWALVVYLFHDAFGGTGFFRHRTTGLTRVAEADRVRYLEQVQQQLPDAVDMHHRFIAGDTSLYQQTGAVAGHYNLAVLFPANCLHSGQIARNGGLSTHPHKGRLTFNALFSVE